VVHLAVAEHLAPMETTAVAVGIQHLEPISQVTVAAAAEGGLLQVWRELAAVAAEQAELER
jgi:hypothetical protein